MGSKARGTHCIVWSFPLDATVFFVGCHFSAGDWHQATLSFGAEREFVLKHKRTRETISYRLGHGSLLVMGGTRQNHWLHSVPKTESFMAERISLLSVVS
jgi:hypothetical protein